MFDEFTQKVLALAYEHGATTLGQAIKMVNNVILETLPFRDEEYLADLVYIEKEVI